MLQLPSSWPYSHAALVLARSVAYFSAAERHRKSNHASTWSALGDSGTEEGSSWASNQVSGVPEARSCVRAFWVKPVPNRFRKSRSREVAASPAGWWVDAGG